MNNSLTVLFFFLLSFSSTVKPLSFGIIHSDESPYVADVQKKLLPFLGNVSLISAQSSTPTAQQLAAFDAILVYSVFTWFDYITLGNLVANYSDSGKGVVVADFALTTFYQSSVLGGRFLGQGNNSYYVISPGTYIYNPQLTLSAVDVNHPILTGVQKFDGGIYSFRGQGTWVADAHPVAVWSDGRTPLIGTRVINGTRRVDVNFYPVSSDIMAGYWVSATDGARILANALNWVVSGTCGNYKDCATCATNSCQWCLDTSVCSSQNLTCADRIVKPGDCPAVSCGQYSKCSTCLAIPIVESCSWCLDNTTCVAKNAPCRGQLNDGRFCSSL